MLQTSLCLLVAVLVVRTIEKLDGTALIGGQLGHELMRTFSHLSLFGLAYLLTWRPLTSLLVAVVVVACFTGANAVKKQVVFEPIVFSDLGLLGQILRHPKLYFLDNFLVVVASVAVVGAMLSAAFWLEPALSWLPAYGIGIIVWGCLFLAKATVRQRFSTVLLNQSLGWGSTRLGLLTALVLQFVCWLDWRRLPRPVAALTIPSRLPDCDVIVVQLESFIDLTPYVRGHSSVWRELQARSQMYGKLRVPARGANTMRTEHAVLSGVANSALQFDRFDPYMRRGSDHYGIPGCLKQRGWRTIFVHPNDVSFFRRDKALPELGFDWLVGQEAFVADRPTGQYVGDLAVIREVIAAARASNVPHFIFAVTMENHGPWRAGRLPGIAAGLPSYLAHQRNTDAALRRLLAFVSSAPRRTLLVLYGDHAPALAQLPPEADPCMTDYLIIDSAGPFEVPDQRELTPEELLGTALRLNRHKVRALI